MVLNIASFAVLGLLWLAFAAALVLNPLVLDGLWQIFRDLPLVAQLLSGLLFLPLLAGLWVWESPWPLWLHLVLIAGLAVATVMAFYPRESSW